MLTNYLCPAESPQTNSLKRLLNSIAVKAL